MIQLKSDFKTAIGERENALHKTLMKFYKDNPDRLIDDISNTSFPVDEMMYARTGIEIIEEFIDIAKRQSANVLYELFMALNDIHPSVILFVEINERLGRIISPSSHEKKQKP